MRPPALKSRGRASGGSVGGERAVWLRVPSGVRGCRACPSHVDSAAGASARPVDSCGGFGGGERNRSPTEGQHDHGVGRRLHVGSGLGRNSQAGARARRRASGKEPKRGSALAGRENLRWRQRRSGRGGFPEVKRGAHGSKIQRRRGQRDREVGADPPSIEQP